VTAVDSFGNEHAPGLPYARGDVVRGTEDDHAKLRSAWRILERRLADGQVFDFTGLERSLDVGDAPPALLDDELAPAVYGARLTELALEHLGGTAGRDDVFVANRLTAAVVAAIQVLVRPGDVVVGVSAGYSHPCVVRAVVLAGGELVDTVGLAGFQEALGRVEPALVVLTRLAVTYEALPGEELGPIVAAARERGAAVFVDDAGGARVGPAVLGQPRTLELGADAGATGLDKYGTSGPRLGLVAGRSELVARIRARAIELGLEARPMLYPAVVRSLERYRAERVRELVRTTEEVGAALAARLGGWVVRTPVAVRLEGDAVLGEAMRRAGLEEPPVVPVEATAALAMALLRDHGILTVHFAAVPPGTAALLVKFVPPETLERFGGAEAFAAAVDASLDEAARLLARPDELRVALGLAANAS
jgi:L-seryl-tRNA(Ser) seleniumtransferase